MAISRRLPISNPGRATALRKAKEKNDSLAQADRFLTPQTQTRLDNIQPTYKEKYEAIDAAQAVYSNAVSLKASTRTALDNHVRGFLSQVISGVRMGKLSKDDKPYYGLNVDSDTYPSLQNDDDLRNVAEKIIAGEAARISNGGTALPWPTAAEVKLKTEAFTDASLAASNKKDALDTAQETVQALNTEADGVIRKVWDEVETFYNEETIESKRNNAREWGVVYYNTDAKPATVNMKVVDAITDQPLPNATATDAETGASSTADSNGNISLKVNHEGPTTIAIEEKDHVSVNQEVILASDETVDLGEVKLVPG